MNNIFSKTQQEDQEVSPAYSFMPLQSSSLRFAHSPKKQTNKNTFFWNGNDSNWSRVPLSTNDEPLIYGDDYLNSNNYFLETLERQDLVLISHKGEGEHMEEEIVTLSHSFHNNLQIWLPPIPAEDLASTNACIHHREVPMGSDEANFNMDLENNNDENSETNDSFRRLSLRKDRKKARKQDKKQKQKGYTLKNFPKSSFVGIKEAFAQFCTDKRICLNLRGNCSKGEKCVCFSHVEKMELPFISKILEGYLNKTETLKALLIFLIGWKGNDKTWRKMQSYFESCQNKHSELNLYGKLFRSLVSRPDHFKVWLDASRIEEGIAQGYKSNREKALKCFEKYIIY